MKQERAAKTISTETETTDNILDFSSTLRELRKNVDPHLLRQRKGWRGRDGHVQMVDYIEWHTVADILDEHAPNWMHTVKDIRKIGDIMTITVAITIDGVTREGIGTGPAQSEIGIKKAEHDALKRAAVKFGIARDLYKKEYETPDPSVVERGLNDSDPVARNLGELVTAKQLGMIRAIARELGISANEECGRIMKCRTDELSKSAASEFITHLQGLENQRAAAMPIRRAS